MRPGARVQAAIEVLETWLEASEGLDRVLATWGRTHRFAGSKDRRAIADLAYDAIRRRRSAAWVAGGSADAGRDLIRGSLLLDAVDLVGLFDGSRHAPAALEEWERTPMCALDEAPRLVRLDLPDWLAGLVAEIPDEELERLRTRAPVDLRVNLLNTDPAAAVAQLAADGIVAEPGPLAKTALRVVEGAARVSTSRAFVGGLIEIQDAASQAVAEIAAPRPGDRVLDLCAGGGGKTLALGALMDGQGVLDAYDIAPARMGDLPRRAERAGLTVRCLDATALARSGPAYDLVMVDAPCSGSGAWRRNPDAKWRLDSERLAVLEATQAEVLSSGAALVAPGGRLVYATCSLLASENAAQVERFLAASPAWRELERRQLMLSDGGDAFFVCVMGQA
ncbi:MAG: RsmB/NOP family class I SAM-dependent RNA methyltransferase [Pseudomonadota bacterium]